MNKYVMVLAAGKGTRMNSRDPEHSKVSYPILGKALINYVLDCLAPLEAQETIVVVGFGGEATKELVKDRATVVWQKEILGTGHASLECEELMFVYAEDYYNYYVAILKNGKSGTGTGFSATRRRWDSPRYRRWK